MRRTIPGLVVGSLLLFGCGSDDSTGATATLAPADGGAVATTAGTAGATESAVATTVVAPAALTPMALCVGNNFEVYFGYDNESTEPVVVAEGEENHLSGALADDNPLLTTLFAPGAVDVAFWAYPEGDQSVVWTLTGPDGVERSATGGSTTELCPSDFLGARAARNPTLEIVDSTLAPDGASVEVDLRLTGIDATSVCNEAFDAGPALVSIGDGSTLPTAFEPDVTLTLSPFRPSPDGGGGLLASGAVYPLIVDQCSASGVTGASWWPPPELSLLTFGTRVCANQDAGGALSVSLTEGLCGLGGTGGSSIRPR